MSVELRPLTHADAQAHCLGEDEETVRWLSGGYNTVEGTRAYFDILADNARTGQGKRGFGIWHDGRLAGYIDFDPSNSDGLEADDVNISYSVHPWARGRGVAPAAVRVLCQQLREQNVGRRVAIRCEPENAASNRGRGEMRIPLRSPRSIQQQIPTLTGHLLFSICICWISTT